MKNRTLFPTHKAPELPKFIRHKYHSLPVYQRKHRIPRGQVYYRLHQLEWKANGNRLMALHEEISSTVNEIKASKAGAE